MRAVRRWACLLLLAAAVAALSALASCGDGDDRAGSPSPPSTATAGVTTHASAPPSSASPLPSPAVARIDVDGSLIVARNEPGGRWALWRVTPSAGTQERVGELPFEPTAASPSPERTKVVYQPQSWRKKLALTLAVLDVASGRIKTVAVHGVELRQVSTLTWLSESQLLAAGPPPGTHSGPEVDLLAQVNARTGAASSFRGLQGSDPDAATGAAKLAYVTAEKAPEGGDDFDGPAVRETLMLTSLDNDSAPKPVVEGYGNDPELTAAHRVMAEPSLSPDGAYVLTVETGSDPQLTYTLRGVDDASVLFDKAECGNPSGTWSTDGRVAFWGIGPRSPDAMRIWVYDVESRSLARSPRLRGGRWGDRLAWSPANDLAIGVIGGDPDDARSDIWLAPGGDLRDFRVLTAGVLPVWVR